MIGLFLAAVGTKKVLWIITSLSVVLLVITPELIVAAGALLAIIFTGIVNIMNARAAAVKQDALQAKATEIAVKVDGQAHAADAKIERLQEHITMLLADKAEKKETAAVLATSAAITPVKEEPTS